jgi:acyl CoA:acetate/3-ketoacid CoA transferase beta subunit
LRKKIVTELAVLEVTPEGFKLLERAPGVTVEHIIASTEAELIIELFRKWLLTKGYCLGKIILTNTCNSPIK